MKKKGLSKQKFVKEKKQQAEKVHKNKKKQIKELRCTTNENFNDKIIIKIISNHLITNPT